MGMSVQEKLENLREIDGFAGAALFSPEGEALAICEGGASSLDIVGVLANNVLMNAQKASMDMGFGRGQFVLIQAAEAMILIRCLNEGTNPLKSEKGKAHIHLVLVLTDETSLGYGKLEINKVIASLADDFR